MTKDQIPPHDLELEESVISAFMSESKETDELLEILDEDDFYSGVNRRLFQVVVGMFKKSQIINIVTIQAELRSLHALETIGGTAHLVELTNAPIHSSRQLLEYAHRLKDKAKLRKALKICQESAAKIYCDPIEDAKLFIDSIEHKFYEIGASQKRSTLADASQVVEDAFRATMKALAGAEGLTGISTGLKAFDELTGGLIDGETTVVAGRPGMAKTSLVTNVCECVAMAGYGALFLSQEMQAEQIGLRLTASRAGIDMALLRS